MKGILIYGLAAFGSGVFAAAAQPGEPSSEMRRSPDSRSTTPFTSNTLGGYVEKGNNAQPQQPQQPQQPSVDSQEAPSNGIENPDKTKTSKDDEIDQGDKGDDKHKPQESSASQTTSPESSASQTASNQTDTSQTSSQEPSASQTSSQTAASQTSSQEPSASQTASNQTAASKAASQEPSSSQMTSQISPSKTASQTSASASSTAQPAPPSKEELAHAINTVQPLKIEIRGSLFIFQEQLPAECAMFSWRVVFSFTTNVYRIEPCQPSEQGRVVTEVEGQRIYGRVIDSKTNGTGSVRLLVDNGALEQVEIQQNKVVKSEPLPQGEAAAKPREIATCDGGNSCSAKPCQDNECDANLEIKYESVPANKSESSEALTLASIMQTKFVLCTVAVECNCVRQCADDKCGVQKPTDSQPSENMPLEQGAAPQSPKAPAEQQGSVPGTKTPETSVSHDGEECVVEIVRPAKEAPKNNGVQPGPKAAPQNDGVQPAAPQQGPPAPQAPQNTGAQPAGRPGIETHKETTTTITKHPLTAPKGQPEAPQPSGLTPPSNAGSPPSRPQVSSTPMRANNGTTPSRGGAVGEPVIVSGSGRTAVAGNVLAVVAAMALLL